MMASNEFLPSYLYHSPINKYKKKTYNTVSLPTHWNSADCWPYVNIIDQDNLKIEYKGPGRTSTDAASIRTNNPIPPEVGLYYFEITVLDKGEGGCIGIGLCKSDVELNILPGWIEDTVGYHGDNGRLYCERGTGEFFGPCYDTGDTVGCGINFLTMEIFFTKNGIYLGKGPFLYFETFSYDDLIEYKIYADMYPMSGMATKGEIIIANFGMKPFMFDIDNYAKVLFSDAELKRELEKETFKILESINSEEI
ncbi:SPRY-domain-containing protein [Gigaspora margarita]|uniref:SPRY-domain-containing protein n=1 Tax=Gigaspora margarita TaxID=4874 RepID=A0A8H4AW51_GIGMA|nr:SPRY-domain-containing protein [Gigaspora margarita]